MNTKFDDLAASSPETDELPEIQKGLPPLGTWELETLNHLYPSHIYSEARRPVSVALNTDFYWTEQSSVDMAGLIKNAISMSSRGENFDRDRRRNLIAGAMRGFWGERVAGACLMEECDTVYPTQSSRLSAELSGISVIDVAELRGGNKKGPVLLESIRLGMNDRLGELEQIGEKENRLKLFSQPDYSVARFNPRKGTWTGVIDPTLSPEEEYAIATQQIAEGYSAKIERLNKPIEVKEVRPTPDGKEEVTTITVNQTVGTLYAETTIPDGILIKTDSTNPLGTIVGAVEVKSYTPEEVEILAAALEQEYKKTTGRKPKVQVKDEETGQILNLGVDLDGITKFMDTVKSERGIHEREGVMTPIIIRFPHDASDDALEIIGAIYERMGYKGIIIQKLPVTSQELDYLGKSQLRGMWEIFEEGNVKGFSFANRELDIMADIAGVERTRKTSKKKP